MRKDLRQIIEIIASYPEGISVGELIEEANFSIPRRSLQRYLAAMIEEGKLETQGQARSRKYLAKAQRDPATSSQDDSQFVAESEETYESPEDNVRAYLATPVTERSPVGYKKNFLESYIPNKTNYLEKETTSMLLQNGQLGKEEMPAGTYLRQILDRLLIDLSWNSSRLEGNTYSLLDTERLILTGEQADEKGARETQMILNHKAAIEMLADQAEEIGFNRYTICNLHALLADNLLPDASAAGRPRWRAVGIGGSVYTPMLIPQTIEEQFILFLEKASAIKNAFEQSFFVMVHLPYMQIFEDVNKRVSRLAANIPLVKRNLCPLSFVDVDQSEYTNALLSIYELNRIDLMRGLYIKAYLRSCQNYSAVRESLGEPDRFNLKYRQELKALISSIVKDGVTRAELEAKLTPALDGLPEDHRFTFAERVRSELDKLHMGNIARYKVRPHVFEKWQDGWD